MSDTAKVTAMVSVIEGTKTFGAKGFRKRLLVLEQENGSFTNYIPIDLIGEMCNEGDALHIGDNVEVEYRLTGRKWQRDASSEVKYFVSLEALAITVQRMNETEPSPSFDASDEQPASIPF